MYDTIFIILGMLFIKHWYVDFVNQDMDEVKSKGNYGEWLGIRHSLKHGIATLIVFGIAGASFFGALFLASIDFIIHYHTDWAKMNYGNRDITTPQFWNHLGLDQLVHAITYLYLVWVALL